MKKLTCEVCGSTDIIKQDGLFVCQSCGTKYSLEEAKKIMAGDTVRNNGSAGSKNFRIVGCKLKEYRGFLDNVVIPNNVTIIDDYAFCGCENLTSVVIPDSVTSIGVCAFSDCECLTRITIPDSVTEIGDKAFSGCESLTSITIGNGVDSIGKDAFDGCENLKSVYITDLAAWCRISFSGMAASPFYNAQNLYLKGKRLTNLVIPEGVTNIGNLAFYNCTSLTSVSIPDSVIHIGERAFQGCKNLKNVVFGTGLKRIEEFTFCSCNSLTDITIPNGVTWIGDSAFSCCSGLTSMTIPNSVTSIGGGAFSSCHGLTSVTISNNVSILLSSTFENCTSLKTAYVPGNLDVKDNFPKSVKIIRTTPGGCYIATCVYGSYDCPQVWTLRRYRDDTLGATWYGRLFIRFYYAVSPTLVKWFGKTQWFQKFWRGKLDRKVKKLQNNGVEDTPYQDRDWRK